MLTVIRLGLPDQLRRSLGCTNAIESLIAVLRQVCRNVKRWRDARMTLRWAATAMLEAEKSFRRLKAHKQLPVLRAALQQSSVNPLLHTGRALLFFCTPPTARTAQIIFRLSVAKGGGKEAAREGAA
jgi:hypothetical protein